jgi:site-specific DNA recombinase
MPGWMPRRTGGRTELDVDPATLNWLLYARESEDSEGDAEQVTNQITDLRSFVGQIGGTIGSEYVENDTSAFRKVRVPLPDGTYGYRVVRPVWDRAMAELRRGNYNAFALPNIDRGMRDPRDLEDLIDLVEHYGIIVVGMTGFLDLTSDAGIAMARNEVNQRNLESRNISRRISAGKRHAALKGRNFGGPNRPFGWKSDKVTCNPVEAELILGAFKKVVAGVRLRSIVKDWNGRGVSTVTGKMWTVIILRQILTNPRLCGLRTYHGEILSRSDGKPVQGIWEPILSEDEFGALQKVLRGYDRVSPRDGRGHATKYLLSPFVRCGKCNGRMRGGLRPGPKGTKVHIYICRGKGDGGCGGCSRIGAEVDKYITALVIEEHRQMQFRIADELPPWNREDELQAIGVQIEEATTAYKNRRISGSRYYPLLEELEKMERDLRSEKARHAAERRTRRVAMDDLEAKWRDPEFTLDQRQAAIAQSLVAVVIEPARPGERFDPQKIRPIWRE